MKIRARNWTLIPLLLGSMAAAGPAVAARADLLAAPPAAAATLSYFNWVDHASAGMTIDNIHLMNPSGSGSSGHIVLPGTWDQPFDVPGGGERYFPVPVGVIGGPVQVRVDGGPAVIASQRVAYLGTISEVAAQVPAAGLFAGWFSWYDHASPGMTADNIHLLNPGTDPSIGTIRLPGAAPIDFTVGPGEERWFSFPAGTIGGPLSFQVGSGPALIASQRVAYLQSFTETAALDPGRAASTLYFNWYDHASPGTTVDDIHILNPGLSTSSGSLSAPGLADIRFSVPPGEDRHFSWSAGLSGPVTIRVDGGPPVLATQRLAMPPLFTEWPAQSAADASSDGWFNWYDLFSAFTVDDVHVANPGAGPASVDISVAGTDIVLAVPAGQDAHYSFPRGTIGGPLRVRVLSGPPVLASQRAWLVPPPPTPSERVLNVPYYHQNYELSCEEAALRMALAFEGVSVSEDQILAAEVVDRRPAYRDSSGAFHWGDPYANFVGDPNGSEIALTGYGTYSSTIDRVARGLGGTVLDSGEGIPASIVYDRVLNGHPVVAWVSFDWRYHGNSHYTAFDGRYVQFGAPYEHAVTVVGVNATSVLINNPWSGQQWVSRSTFESAFATFNNMAVVLQ